MRRNQFSQGFAHLVLVLVLAVGLLVIGVAVFFVLKDRLTSSNEQSKKQSQSNVQLKTEYKNPFDEKTQYKNPFEEKKNPFDNLK